MKKTVFVIFMLTILITGGMISNSLALNAEGTPYDDKSDFIGSESCKKCHLKAFNAWRETNLSRALIVLGPRNSMETKKKIGIDPYKDYTRDPACLKCHTTGFKMNQDGTYTFSEYGIGCEACHGAGKKYSAIMKMKGRTYKREELVKAGLNLDFEKTCLKCHNEESPLIGKEYIFSHKERYKGVHGDVELKYHKKIERFTDEKE